MTTISLEAFLPRCPRKKKTYPVFIIIMQLYAALLRVSPMLRNTVIDVRLVYDPGYQLWQVVDGGRVWRRYFKAVDGVGGAIFDQKGEKGEDAMNKPGDNEGVDEDEDGKAATHVCEYRTKGGGQALMVEDAVARTLLDEESLS